MDIVIVQSMIDYYHVENVFYPGIKFANLCKVCYEIDRDRPESMWNLIKVKSTYINNSRIPHCYDCGETVIEHAMD